MNNYSEYLQLCSTEASKSHGFGTTWEWQNDIYIFLCSCFYSPAMFAFHPKDHVFLTHLTCLGEPWLCRKPINAHTHTQNHLYVSGTEFNNNFHRFCSIKESIGGGETCEWQPARCLSWGEPEVSCGGRYLESDRTDRDSLNESLQLIKYL